MDIQLKNKDKVLIIHHWDCDGLCSAALIMRYLLEVNDDISICTATGEIGKYYFTPEKLEAFRNEEPDHIVLCDYAVPAEDILKLKDISEDLIIFDHHKQEEVKQAVHINPFIRRDVDGLMYPSTGWVINTHLCRPQEILAALGAVGDQEELIKQDNTVMRVLKENGLDFGQAMKIVENIDSCYIAGDEGQIRDLVKFLSEEVSDIRSLLDDKRLLENRKKIASAIKGIVDSEKDIDKVKKTVCVKYDSNYHIISNVTRELARNFPDYLAVVVSDPGSREANIYFRTRMNMDLRPIIRLAHTKGYNAGGKKEVTGIILPGKDVSGFIEQALGVLGL